MKKLFLSLLVLFTLTSAVFAQEKSVNLTEKVFSANVDDGKASLYFCDDGYVIIVMESRSGKDVMVMKYSYNQSANIGAIYDSSKLDDSDIILMEYNSKKGILYLTSDDETLEFKEARKVTPRKN